MTNRISSPCVIFPIIILGIIFLIAPSSYAQGTSVSREQEEITQSMRYSLIALKECEEGQTQLGNIKNRETLEKLYDAILEKKRSIKIEESIFKKAKSAAENAERSYSAAVSTSETMHEKCRRAMEATKLEWEKIQSCIDSASFNAKVVEPRHNTLKEKLKVSESELEKYFSSIQAAQAPLKAYYEALKKILGIPLLILINEDENIDYISPDQIKNGTKEVCGRHNSKMQNLIKRAISIADSFIKACKPGEADIFVQSLPEFNGKKELQKGIRDTRLREDVVQVNYEEGRSLYRKGQIEEMKGNVSQAQDLYRKAIAKMQEGRKSTKCDSRVKQFDKAIGQINSHQTQEATPKIGNCDIPKDFAVQKKALHARIKKGNIFREDGGGQWNPTFVMRAGYSVGSEQLKATALALNAMSNLVGGYEQCYATYWSFMEGELVQLTKARDAAYKKSWAEGQRLNGILGKRKAEAASALNTCIIDSDNTFKAAMKKAQELCK